MDTIVARVNLGFEIAFFVVGVVCLLIGVLRLGFITELLSKPIRYGYMNGIALTVLISQLRIKAIEDGYDPTIGILHGLKAKRYAMSPAFALATIKLPSVASNRFSNVIPFPTKRRAPDVACHRDRPNRYLLGSTATEPLIFTMTVKPHRADTLHPKKSGLQRRSTDDAPTIDRCQPEHIE